MGENLKIRRLIKKDIPEIIQLFRNRKSDKELNWILRDPENPLSYNAFVAITNEDIIVGVIGYVLSTFLDNKKLIKGVIPMLWLIRRNYRGLAGILLLKKVLELGEFGYGIEGTQMAQELFLKFKYNKVSQRFSYKKTYDPIKYFIDSDKSFIDKIVRIIPRIPNYVMSFQKPSIYKDIELIKYNGDNYFEEGHSDSVFHVNVNKRFIDWLNACPFLESYVFGIKHKDKKLGMCVFYINQSKEKRLGRIVYMPYLGKDIKLWNTVIKKSLKFFKDKNCFIVDTIGINHHHVVSLQRFGFIKSVNPQPIFLRDPKQLLKNVNFDDMHMQYTEGDNAYIGL